MAKIKQIVQKMIAVLFPSFPINLFAGLVTVDLAPVLNAKPISYSGTGVCVANDRITLFVPDANGINRKVLVTVYVQREPMDENESSLCATRKAEIKQNKAEKQAEQERLQQIAADRNLEAGQKSVVTAFANIDKLATGFAMLAKLRS